MFSTLARDNAGWARTGTRPMEAYRNSTFELFWAKREYERPTCLDTQERRYFTYMRKHCFRTPGCSATAFLTSRASRAKAPEALKPYLGEWRREPNAPPRTEERHMTFADRMTVMSVGVGKFVECMLVHWQRYCNRNGLEMTEESLREFGELCTLDLPVSRLILCAMHEFSSFFPKMYMPLDPIVVPPQPPLQDNLSNLSFSDPGLFGWMSGDDPLVDSTMTDQAL